MALEPFVRRPAGEEHAEDSGDLEHMSHWRATSRDALRLTQQKSEGPQSSTEKRTI